MRRLTVSLLTIVLLLTQSISVFAFETDQFNLPPQPIADIGNEVTRYVISNIEHAVNKLNAEIKSRQNCLDKATNSENLKCASENKNRRRLAYLRSEQAIADEIYNLLGTGIPPFTSSGSWLESHHFTAEPARYRTSFRHSIYFTFPVDYLDIGSTVNLYDTEFGTDKIAHFFQQGYSYYKIYNQASEEGSNSEQAAQKAVKWGQKTERTVYGTLISGVYSNADLYANYAGMKFYSGLTKPLEIGSTIRPAPLSLEDGLWKFDDSEDTAQQIIKPFISNHLNEALNPSVYTNFLGLRAYVRHTVRKQSCREWFEKYPDLSQEELQKTSNSLEMWNGEDYGFTDSKNFITIANTCFGNENSSGAEP